jgi:hypothetical protein
MSSGLHGIGTGSLLDDFIDLAPTPAERTSFTATTLGGIRSRSRSIRKRQSPRWCSRL